MTYENYETFLGGSKTNLEWVDLAPSEIVQATVGSVPRAKALIDLALLQYDAAMKLDDLEAAAAYKEVARQLSGIARVI
jgi:hypothetical protein